MWKEIQRAQPFYILFLQDNVCYEINITDYVKIWMVKFNTDEFISCLMESNFGLEIDSNELIANGIQILTEPEKLKNVNITKEGDNLKVSLCRSFGYPLKLTILLNLGSPEYFFQKITQPLLKTIKDLRSSESELRFLLKSKDKEIEEYKVEAGEICLRYLKTKVYNDEAHMERHTSYDIHFGPSEISDSILEKLFDVEDTQKKEENIEVKTEPTSQASMEVQIVPENTIKKEIKIEHQVTPKKRKLKLNL